MKNFNDLLESLDMTDEVDEVDEFAVEDDNESTFVIRGKWILDGADNLVEAAEMARAYADFLEGLASDGYTLRASIEDDYGFAQLA
jgi:hypothetical protein